MSTKVERRSTTKDSKPCIHVDSLCKRFGSVEAIRDVSFDVAVGQIVALVGANGSGKTTLLQMLFGLCGPDAGKVSVLGLNPIRESKALYAVAKFLSQQFSLDHELTGNETLKFFSSLCGISKYQMQRDVPDVLQRFGLSDFSSRRIADWSGGMKQRLHLALCSVGDSKLMLLDEPTSNLDPSGTIDFWMRSKEYADAGGTVLLTTHDLKNAERYASRVILLDQGSLLLNETPDRIRHQHCRPVVFATLVGDEFPGQTLKNLESLPDVFEIEVRERQLSIILVDENSKDAAIVAEFEKQGVVVESYRRETGLAAAYYALAGKQLSSHQPTKKERRQGRGGKRQ